MQGNLDEIDIGSILELIEAGQVTGLLYLETNSLEKNSNSDTTYFCSDIKTLIPKNMPKYKTQTWLVFFYNGQIVYAFDSNSGVCRLEDYLFHYQIPKKSIQGQLSQLSYKNTCMSKEYLYLCKYLEKNFLQPQQACSIVCASVYETLFDLFRLHQGRFFIETNTLIAPHLTTLRFSSIKNNLKGQLQSWRSMYPYIASPEQFLVLNDINRLNAKLPKTTVKKLQYWAENKTSLRRLARFINKGVSSVAKAIYPYILEGSVKLKYPDVDIFTAESKPEKTDRASVVCIESVSGSSWSQAVFSVLNEENLIAIALENSWETLGEIFKIQPNLILCDTDMPVLDGYEICAMLRNSSKFSDLPIIMMSGRNEEFNYIKAKAYGATDCLNKSFSSIDLKSKISKYLDIYNFSRQ
ncbi:MAG: response regulator [Cyanobacteria bacterium P01_A01_bin.45]